LCVPAALLALLLATLLALPAGAQAPPDEEVKPVPVLTGSTGFITTFDGGELQTPDKVYRLDAQVLAEQWAGLKVRIVGTLDPKTDVSAVRAIEPASPSAGKTPPPK
jgi:hypothetical protein